MEKLLLDSKNYDVKKLLANLKNNKKNYSKLINFLFNAGYFDEYASVEVFLSEVVVEDKKNAIKLYCYDKDNNIFEFYGDSNIKKDYDCVKFYKDDKEYNYDLSLIKNYEVNPSNIELLRSDKVINTKFGRLITDDKSYYNFFSKDIAYQTIINSEEKLDGKVIASEINKMGKIPSFVDYCLLFDNLFEKGQIIISIECSSFEKMEKTAGFVTAIDTIKRKRTL